MKKRSQRRALLFGLFSVMGVMGVVGAHAEPPAGPGLPPPSFSDPAVAAGAQIVPAGPERDAVLKAASEALDRVKLAQGEFLQIQDNGQVVSGKFALRRPGRMRFDYDAPSPLLLVADGANVAVQDRKLKTTDRVPLRQTPLFLILKQDVDIARDAQVISVSRARGEVNVTLTDRKKETEGQLRLVFSAGDYELLEWSVTDPQGVTTEVVLRNVTTPQTLDPRLFVVADIETGPRK